MESRYSQPKIELYGLFRALKALEYLLWGINVVVEADASFLKAMTNSPGLPNAAATRWIAYIQLFDLEFKHIPADNHRIPDGLPRRRYMEEDTENTEIENEDEREDGSFIRAGRPLHPPGQILIDPDTDDKDYISITKLTHRRGEPLDTIRRRNGTSLEQLHLAYIEPSTEASKATYGFMIINVPTIGENKEPVAMVANRKDHSEEWRNQGKEKDGHQNISEAEQLHPNHVLDDDREEYWKNIIQYLETLKVPKEVNN